MKIKILLLFLALIAVVGSIVYVVVREPHRPGLHRSDAPAPAKRTPNSSEDYKR
jgi:hypothetical protein